MRGHKREGKRPASREPARAGFPEWRRGIRGRWLVATDNQQYENWQIDLFNLPAILMITDLPTVFAKGASFHSTITVTDLPLAALKLSLKSFDKIKDLPWPPRLL